MSVLQLCHDTKGPFVGICRQYTEAFEGHDITTIFLKGEKDDEASRQVGGTQVIFLEEGGRSSKRGLRGLKLGVVYKMIKHLRRNHYDIAIAHRYKALYILGIMTVFFSLPRILAIAHEYNMFLRSTRRLFIRTIGAKIRIAGVSKVVTSDIASKCPFLLSEERLFTLYNTIPELGSGALLSKRDARKKLGLSESGLVIGSIGRLVKKKNQKMLIQAFSELEVAGSQLLIIGSGPEESSLRRSVLELDLEDSVIFAGHRTEAKQYLNAFDIFVFPSGPEEAFGIVLLEAMQAKATILSSNAPGPNEVLGSSATLFEVDNVRDLSEKLKLALGKSEAEKQKLLDEAYDRCRGKFGKDQFKTELFRTLDLTEQLPLG